MKRFREGLAFKAHRLVYHSTLGWRVIKKKNTPHLVNRDRQLTSRGNILSGSRRLYQDTNIATEKIESPSLGRGTFEAEVMVHNQDMLMCPSFRALSGRLKFTVRRHKFNKDSFSS